MNWVSQLMAADGFLWMVGGLIAIVAIVCGTVTSMLKVVSRERSRREIAAYIAEGSLTPEQGERLMKAGVDPNND
jgi:hypothetical protein